MRSVNPAVVLVCVVIAAGVGGCETQSQTAIEPVPPSQFQRAYAYETDEQFEKAQRTYRDAIKEDPEDSRAYVNLGRLQGKAGKPDVAEAYYRKAIQVNPKDAVAYNLLGGLYMRQRQHQKALACYQKAVEADPEYANGHWNIATAYRSLGFREEAARHYRTYIWLASPEDKDDMAEANRYLTAVGDE